MGLPYRQKEQPYLLVIILGDLITYKGGIIHLNYYGRFKYDVITTWRGVGRS